MFPRTLFLGSSLNRGNPPPWPKPIPRGHKEKAKKSSSKIDRIDRSACHEGKRPAKHVVNPRSIVRSVLCDADDTSLLRSITFRTRSIAEYFIDRKKYLQNPAFLALRSVFCGVSPKREARTDLLPPSMLKTLKTPL